MIKKYTYTRTCTECKETATVGYKPKANSKCKRCSGKLLAKGLIQNRWKNKVKKIYYYFCPHCPSVVVKKSTKKTSLCVSCSRKRARRINKTIVIQTIIGNTNIVVPIMKFYRVCEHCGNTKEVKQVAHSRAKYCIDCRCKNLDMESIIKKRSKTIIDKCITTKKKNNKSGSKLMTKANIEIAREKNRIHREEVKMRSNKVHINNRSDKSMIAIYLANNKVTKIVTQTL